MNRIDLMRILIDDRNYHFEHPHSVNLKFFYSAGGTLSALIIALIYKSDNLESVTKLLNADALYFGILCIGYLMVIIGLIEHMTLHKEQRKQLERAINYCFACDNNTFKYEEFVAKFSKKKHKYFFLLTSKVDSSLFDIEPDNRNEIFFHDRKIELGIVLIILSLIKLIYTILTH